MKNRVNVIKDENQIPAAYLLALKTLTKISCIGFVTKLIAVRT